MMNPIPGLTACLLMAHTLTAQTASEIAEKLPSPTYSQESNKLIMPPSEIDGAKVELLGADYEQIVNKDTVHQVLSDVPVTLSVKVTKDGQEAYKDFVVTISAPHGERYTQNPHRRSVPLTPGSVNPKPNVIPALLEWRGLTGDCVLDEDNDLSVYISDTKNFPRFIPEYLEKAFGFRYSKVVTTNEPSKAKLRFRLTHLQKDIETLGEEGYRMHILPDAISITYASPTGAFYAVQSLLQIARQNAMECDHVGYKIPCGEAIDFPRYKIRGFVFDIARTHYTLDQLLDVVDTMAWYKMNDLHLVINNNFIFHETYVDAGRDPFRECYAAFRLESSVKSADGSPLTSTDIAYSKKDFRKLIRYAKQRGVNIVPEFDTPGHALALTRIRPDLIYKGPMHGHEKRRSEMLDAANPATLTFVEKVLDEYLTDDKNLGNKPLFDKGSVIHVGADEFFGAAEDYRKYTDGLLRYVRKRGYTPRIWGSLSQKRGKTPVLSEGVQMNLWNTSWMNTLEAVRLGYDVINTNDANLYIVPFANYYRADKNLPWLYNSWQPNRMYNEQLPAAHKQLLGAAFAVWNDTTDLRHTGYGILDIWDDLTGAMQVLSQKTWGTAVPPHSYEQHRELAAGIGDAPLTDPYHKHNTNPYITNLSPEQLPMQTKLASVGPDYHLTTEIEMTEAPQDTEQVLLSAPEGTFYAAMKDGRIGFRRSDGMQFAYDAKLPVGQRVKLELIGTLGYTKLFLNGKQVTGMQLLNYRNAEENFRPRTKGICSTFILPLQTIGASFRGKIYTFSVTNEVFRSPCPSNPVSPQTVEMRLR